MIRYNVELKYQTTIDAKDENEAYRLDREELLIDVPKSYIIHSHCRKVKNKVI